MNPLRQLQEDAVTYLLGNPAMAVVGYASFRKQAIDSAFREALAGWDVRVEGKIGVNCLVLMPSCYCDYPEVPGVQLRIELIIRTFEDPKVNNTGLSAEDVALANLQWFGDGLLIAGLTEIFPDKKGPALKPNYDFPGFLVYDTVLTGELPQDYVGRTPQPVITDDNAGNVTINCADPNALVYYALGGVMPHPGDQSGTGNTIVYNGPFQVPSGTVLRVLAYNQNLLPSFVDLVTININPPSIQDVSGQNIEDVAGNPFLQT